MTRKIAPLLRFRDDAASNTRRSAAARATSNSVNHDGGAPVAENGSVIGAHCNVRSDGSGVGCAVSGNDQCKVRNVASRHTHALVGVTSGKVWTGSLEIGRLALRELMNVERVFARRKILDVQRDFHSLRSGRQSGSSDTLTLGIFDFHGNRLGWGLGVGILRECRACAR